MTDRVDNQSLLLRARNPVLLTATGDVFPQGTRGIITCFVLTPVLADDGGFELRDGGAGGTLILEARGKKKEYYSTPFPSGLRFDDGLHCTMTGFADPVVTFIGVSEPAP